MDYLEELKQRKQWVNYVITQRKNGKMGKPPINPHTLRNGSSADPGQWVDYKTAVRNKGSYATFTAEDGSKHTLPIAGTSVVLTDGLCGIDLDHVIEDGKIKAAFVMKLITALDTYTEFSVSGTGLHLLLYAKDLPSDLSGKFKVDGNGNLNKNGKYDIEIYSHKTGGGHCFTVTENVFHNRPINKDVSDRIQHIFTTYDNARNKQRENPQPTLSPVGSDTPPERTDAEVLEVAFRFDKDGSFKRLYEGDLSMHGDDHSNADLAFTNKLASWTNGNRVQIDRIFRNSGLMREKWDRPIRRGSEKTYGQYTIDKALENFTPYRRSEDNELSIDDVKQAVVDAREASKPEPLINRIRPIGSYVDGFITECENPKPRYSTGFLSLDKRLNGGLFNELYILNAETSTGKSAISMTIAQNMAQEGMNVLYFALEMGRNEFIARGASAISWEKTEDPDKAVTAADILYYHFDEKMLPFMEEGKDPFTKIPYSKYAEYVEEYRKRYENNLYIIERPQVREVSGNAKVSGDAIAKITREFYKAHQDKQLAVFVDYLQILEGEDTDRKTKTDKNISDLKDLCTQEKIPVFTISSIGRSGYRQGADIGNAKESGDIEYTTGVALGWDWDGVTNHNKKTWKDQRTTEEQKRLDRETYKNRLMRMSLLKYRNSERDTQDGLIYYPQYNYFRELDEDLDVERIDDLKALDAVDIKDLLSGKVRI